MIEQELFSEEPEPPVRSKIPLLALFCSSRCPGQIILDAYDFCQTLRDQPVTVASGFHAPMERECLRLLLRSRSKVIWVLARAPLARTPPDLQQAVADERLEIRAPFPPHIRHATAESCQQRNRIVAAMADATLIVHAEPNSKIQSLANELLSERSPVFTFEHPGNSHLIEAGARPVTPATPWQTFFAPQRSKSTCPGGASSA